MRRPRDPDYFQKYYQAHKDEYAKRTKEWREKHPERVKKFQRESYHRHKDVNKAWAQNNPEKCRARSRRYRKKHPERHAHQVTLRDSRIRGASGRCSHSLWMARVLFYGWRCFYCKVSLVRETLTKDH